MFQGPDWTDAVGFMSPGGGATGDGAWPTGNPEKEDELSAFVHGEFKSEDTVGVGNCCPKRENPGGGAGMDGLLDGVWNIPPGIEAL